MLFNNIIPILNVVTATDGEVAVAKTGIWIAFVLFYIAVFVIVVAPLVTTIINNPKSIIPLLGGLVILAILYGIGYALAPSDISAIATKKGMSEGQFQAVGGALMTMAILAILAILSFVADTVLSIIR